jgi:hypothetical protein
MTYKTVSPSDFGRDGFTFFHMGKSYRLVFRSITYASYDEESAVNVFSVDSYAEKAWISFEVFDQALL